MQTLSADSPSTANYATPSRIFGVKIPQTLSAKSSGDSEFGVGLEKLKFGESSLRNLVVPIAECRLRSAEFSWAISR